MATITTGDALLRVENVSIRYPRADNKGWKQVVRDVTFEIKDIVRPALAGSCTPQIVGCCAPSGSGKSTLFRAISGLEPRHAGYEGRVLLNKEGTPVRPGQVGVVPQNYRLFRYFTVVETLALAGRQGGMAKNVARETAMTYLERFGLADIARLYPSQISGGQRQRVSILEQLMCSSHFLLMDEPFSGLDPKAKREIIELIWEVMCTHEYNTCIITSHDVKSVLRVADRVLVLGHDRNPDGTIVPGSRIQRDIDLTAMGLAFHPELHKERAFQDLVVEIEEMYDTL